MPISKAPAAETPIDAALVRSLLQEQHPDLAALPLTQAGEGWDNTLFRLGADLVVRLPRRQIAAELVEHERRWLPELAPRLPLPVPAPVRVGRPALGYPWTWVVSPWLPGRTAAERRFDDERDAARRLGHFLGALHHPAPADAPANPFRATLASRADTFLEHVRILGSLIDAVRAAAVWESALAAPHWTGRALWLHGDLHPENVLVDGGRLSAVIDFGDITSGDPAVDLSVAWMLFSPDARVVFRESAVVTDGDVDDATWARARGWALLRGIVYLAHSLDNPLATRVARTTIDAVLADRTD